MTDQLISFETAKLAEEKGFTKDRFSHFPSFCYTINANGYKEGILNHVSVGIPAPTQSLLQKWLREKYNIHIIIEPEIDPIDDSVYYRWRGRIKMRPSQIGGVSKTYEEALEQGLQEALKLID